MSKIVGLIGYPLKHSLSPVFQQAAFDSLGIDARYEAWETPPEALGEAVQRVRGADCWGMNVTIPHKESIVPLLDEVEQQAWRLGAVNTVLNRHGRLVGYNTDATGFLRALQIEGGFDPRGRKVLILGAGGVARAAVGALVDAEAAAVVIANRGRERAERIAVEAASWLSLNKGDRARPAMALEVIDWQRSALSEEVSKADLIVNCTPMGMRHGPGEQLSALAGISIPARAMVYDLVYVPAVTPLLQQAIDSGAKTLGGLPMLIYQGAAAFEIWTNQPAPFMVMLQAAEAALRA